MDRLAPSRFERTDTYMKTALITGAGTSFGKEAAFRLAEKSFDVIAAVERDAQVQTLAIDKLFAATGAVSSGKSAAENQLKDRSNPLIPPEEGTISVAFPISRGAVIIDFCGPWEVFNSADVPGHQGKLFQTYTVAETLEPITAGGGMKIIPNYTFKTAPPPKVVVIPAQSGSTEAMLKWIRSVTEATDVTMSVCVGAFLLAETGLLSGKSATTFHEAYARFAAQYPEVHLERGASSWKTAT
jgi:putative intracellular protease/amidase